MKFYSYFLALVAFSNVSGMQEQKHVHFDLKQESEVRKSTSSPNMSSQKSPTDNVPKSFSYDQLIFTENVPQLRSFRRGSATTDHLRAWTVNTYLLANNLFTLAASQSEIDLMGHFQGLSSAIAQTQTGFSCLSQLPEVKTGLSSMKYVNQAKSIFREEDISTVAEFMKEWTDALKQDVKRFPTSNRLGTLQNCIDLFKNVSSVY